MLRAVLTASGIVAVLGGFLPWEYDEAFGGGWQLGVELSSAWPILILGAASARLCWSRAFLAASIVAALCALGTWFLKAFMSSGWFGEPPRPQGVGAGVHVTLIAALVVVVGGVIAKMAVIERSRET